MADALPALYTDLAEWYLLLTAPEEYAEEAAFYVQTLVEALGRPPRTLLELGAGAGNNAWHYKHQVGRVTLSDVSADMLAHSRAQNPECEQVVGDMRTLRLGRQFDAVFAHDAIGYLTTERDLRQALQTAFDHCAPGGVALFVPDHTRDTFAPGIDCGGNDGDGRALRYLEWTFDPDPSDTTYLVDYAYVLHADGQPPRTLSDRHELGLFARADWLRLLGEVGFVEARVVPFDHSELPPGTYAAFVGGRPC